MEVVRRRGSEPPAFVFVVSTFGYASSALAAELNAAGWPSSGIDIAQPPTHSDPPSITLTALRLGQGEEGWDVVPISATDTALPALGPRLKDLAAGKVDAIACMFAPYLETEAEAEAAAAMEAASGAAVSGPPSQEHDEGSAGPPQFVTRMEAAFPRTGVVAGWGRPDPAVPATGHGLFTAGPSTDSADPPLVAGAAWAGLLVVGDGLNADDALAILRAAYAMRRGGCYAPRAAHWRASLPDTPVGGRDPSWHIVADAPTPSAAAATAATDPTAALPADASAPEAVCAALLEAADRMSALGGLPPLSERERTARSKQWTKSPVSDVAARDEVSLAAALFGREAEPSEAEARGWRRREAARRRAAQIAAARSMAASQEGPETAPRPTPSPRAADDGLPSREAAAAGSFFGDAAHAPGHPGRAPTYAEQRAAREEAERKHRLAGFAAPGVASASWAETMKAAMLAGRAQGSEAAGALKRAVLGTVAAARGGGGGGGSSSAGREAVAVAHARPRKECWPFPLTLHGAGGTSFVVVAEKEEDTEAEEEAEENDTQSAPEAWGRPGDERGAAGDMLGTPSGAAAPRTATLLLLPRWTPALPGGRANIQGSDDRLFLAVAHALRTGAPLATYDQETGVGITAAVREVEDPGDSGMVRVAVTYGRRFRVQHAAPRHGMLGLMVGEVAYFDDVPVPVPTQDSRPSASVELCAAARDAYTALHELFEAARACHAFPPLATLVEASTSALGPVPLSDPAALANWQAMFLLSRSSPPEDILRDWQASQSTLLRLTQTTALVQRMRDVVREQGGYIMRLLEKAGRVEALPDGTYAIMVDSEQDETQELLANLGLFSGAQHDDEDEYDDFELLHEARFSSDDDDDDDGDGADGSGQGTRW